MTRYASGISYGIFVPIGLVFVGAIILTAITGPWFALLIPVAIAIFLVLMLLKTYYEIDGKILRIHGGLFFRQEIRVTDILSIKETNNPLSSPALSLDRLEIRYGKYKWVLISPKKKDEFIQELLVLNPSITFIPRKKQSHS